MHQRALDDVGGVALLGLRVPRSQLLACFEPRDVFARRHFSQTIWDVPMVAHWAHWGTSDGYLDLGRSRACADDYHAIDEALRTGRLTAIVDGECTGAEYWADREIASHRGTRFRQADVLKAFPREEPSTVRRGIANLLDALPDGTARSAAISKAGSKFPASAQLINATVTSNPRFAALKQGRPAGSKSKKEERYRQAKAESKTKLISE